MHSSPIFALQAVQAKAVHSSGLHVSVDAGLLLITSESTMLPVKLPPDAWFLLLSIWPESELLPNACAAAACTVAAF